MPVSFPAAMHLRLRALSCLTIVAAALGSGACGAAVSAPAVDTHQRYHDGQRWVEVVVLLDRLHVERVDARGQPASREIYLVRTPVASVAELQAVARQMRAAQPDIAAISAYVTAGGPGAMRLTDRVVVQGDGSADELERLVTSRGATVVNRAEGAPVMRTCRPAGDDLLGALHLAAALRGLPGVAFALPVIERQHAHRGSQDSR